MQLAAVSAMARLRNQCRTIDSPGHYILAKNLNCTDTDGIDILAPDVELNLDGHAITGGSDNTGVDISSSRDRVLGPGTINGLSVGIKANYGSREVEVIGVTSAGASGVGFVGRYAEVTWRGNTATGASVGFELLPGDSSELSGNRAAGNADGFLISGSNDYLMLNTSMNNTEYGIAVYGSHNEMISNVALDNTTFDLFDGDHNCGDNRWNHNKFKTANETCIR